MEYDSDEGTDRFIGQRSNRTIGKTSSHIEMVMKSSGAVFFATRRCHTNFFR
jgi:hypothetical protein